MNPMSNTYHREEMEALEHIARCVKDSNLENLQVLLQIRGIMEGIHDKVVAIRDIVNETQGEKQ